MRLPRLRLTLFERRRVRPQFQAESAECGLTCLAMILSSHGRAVDSSTLRRKFGASIKGVTLAHLVQIAGQQDLLARPLRLPLRELAKLATPCILHWNINHFVVLEYASRTGIGVIDPAVGRRFHSWEQASKYFTGIALELEPGTHFRKRRRKAHLRLSRFFEQTGNLHSTIAQVIALSVALQVFALIAPFYMQLVMDKVIVGGDRDLLTLASTAFLALTFFSALTAALRGRVTIFLNARLDYRWSSGLFGHLLSLPWSYFERRQVGDIQSRFRSLKYIRELVASTSIAALIDGGMALSTLVVLFIYNRALALIVVASALLYLALRLLVLPIARSRSLEFIVDSAKTDGLFLETLRGMLPIRNFCAETGRQQLYRQQVASAINSGARAAATTVWIETARQLIFGASNIAVIALGANSIIDGKMTAGMLLAFIAYATHFSGRGAALIDACMQFRLARNHLDRLADIVETPAEVSHRQTSIRRRPVSPLTGVIDVRNIWYRYGKNEPPVIRGASLSIENGSQVAITGPSGCGKSTLLKILVGLIRPDAGELLVGGCSIDEIGLENYRKQIGVVMQNDQLLGGTLLANLSLFSPSPDIGRVEKCCEIAGIDVEIEAMPMGLYTLVGDMGDALSGGQRQRILLARALYREPRILFLDEATSNLDAAHELHAVRALSALNITRVIIAHRRETIRHADRVIELH